MRAISTRRIDLGVFRTSSTGKIKVGLLAELSTVVASNHSTRDSIPVYPNPQDEPRSPERSECCSPPPVAYQSLSLAIEQHALQQQSPERRSRGACSASVTQRAQRRQREVSKPCMRDTIILLTKERQFFRRRESLQSSTTPQ